MVRPAWMTDETAAEWLTVAASDLAHMDVRTVAAAAKEARATCTHHGQIIPAILASRAVSDERQFQALKRGLGWPTKPQQLEDKSETQKLIESTARNLKA